MMEMETWKNVTNNHIDSLLHLYIMAARWRYNTINDSASSDSSVHQTLMSLLAAFILTVRRLTLESLWNPLYVILGQ